MRTLIVAIGIVVAASFSVGAASGATTHAAIILTAANPAQASLDANTEKCIRDNAPMVEQAVPDIGQAVDFLVGKVCANEVAAQGALETERQQSRMSEQWQRACDEQKAAKKDGADANQNSVDYCSFGKIGFLADPNDGGYTLYSPGMEPAAAMALAARLLLDLRLSHTSTMQRH